MRNTYGATVFFLQILFLSSPVSQRCNAESTVTETSGNSKQTKTITPTQKFDETPQVTKKTSQRSLLESSQWTVKSLKSTDFTTQVRDIASEQPNQQCKPVKVADIVEKRRQAYERDASVIQFVSAHALPVNASSLHETPCEAQARRNLAKKRRRTRVQDPAKVGKYTKTGGSRPCREGEVEGDECDINNRMPEAGPHDYEVSSIEYYDEDPVHDIKDCPDDMEIVTLEMEELRQYDYQCEIITKWLGLD